MRCNLPERCEQNIESGNRVNLVGGGDPRRRDKQLFLCTFAAAAQQDPAGSRAGGRLEQRMIVLTSGASGRYGPQATGFEGRILSWDL
jgi:hypothetical protein